MIDRNPNPLQPQWSTANQVYVEQALAQITLDNSLFARRGRLYLLCDDTDSLAAAKIYTLYYSPAKFDPMRNLQQAVKQAAENADEKVLAGALVHHMTLYICGMPRVRAWIWRNHRLVGILPNPKGEALGTPNPDESSAAKTDCQSAERRLYPGDCIILADSGAERRMSAKLLRRAAINAPHQDSFARSVAQALRTYQYPHPLITIIQLPGSAATPQLPAQSQMEFAHASSIDLAPKNRGLSPVIVGIILVLAAIITVMIVSGPKITASDIRNILIGTPNPTQTSEAQVTGTPSIEPTPQPENEIQD